MYWQDKVANAYPQFLRKIKLVLRSPAPSAPPCSQALQLSVLLIWHLLPSNILYCSLERKYDVKKKTWALMLALAPAL